MQHKIFTDQILSIASQVNDLPPVFDDEAIEKAYQQKENRQSLVIKILSIFGGILASIAFLGFLFIAGITDSGTGAIIVGSLSIAAAFFVSKKQDNILIDTIIVSAYLMGYVLLGFGFFEMNIHENLICALFIIISMICLSLGRNYILSFISVLIINGSILSLIIFNDRYNMVYVYISVLVLLIVFVFLKEAKIISGSRAFAILYSPVRTGLVFSLLGGLLLDGTKIIRLFGQMNLKWVSSVVICLSIAYLVYAGLKFLRVNRFQERILIYILSVLVILPLVFTPAVLASILIILLSFFVNYRTGFVAGVIAFIYFLSKSYYDLDISLLIKSVLLLISGILFLAIYLFTRKQLLPDEKI